MYVCGVVVLLGLVDGSPSWCGFVIIKKNINIHSAMLTELQLLIFFYIEEYVHAIGRRKSIFKGGNLSRTIHFLSSKIKIFTSTA